MEAKNVDKDNTVLDMYQRRKRKRSSSETSYLEPAIFDEPAELRHHAEKKHYRHSERRHRHESDDHALFSDAQSLTTSSVSSLLRPAKTYERKARHKTKWDKYDIKKDKTGRPSKEKKARTRKRHKHSERHGAALLHNFTADNVASERLTVR